VLGPIGRGARQRWAAITSSASGIGVAPENRPQGLSQRRAHPGVAHLAKCRRAAASRLKSWPDGSDSTIVAGRRHRDETQQRVAELLQVAKRALGLSLTFLSRLDGQTQHLEVVESSIPLFRDGQTQPQETSFCQAILDGKLPPVIPDVTKLPEAKRLPAARFPRIRSYVSVPVRLSDGTLYGTFCAAGFTADRQLAERDRALMEVLAQAAATVIEPGVRERERVADIRARLDLVFEAGGPTIVMQPIVDLATGARVGAEVLSRFPPEWERTPDVVFAEAASIGAGTDLELLVVRRAAEVLHTVSGYVAINLSPDTLLSSRCARLLTGLPLERVLLELSEHEPVEDYDALADGLAGLRARGARLAIDDVGAGFSSLRHIVLSAPDVIKLDRGIVTGVAGDPVLRTLARSLTDFAHEAGARVVAEGVETDADAAALRDLGVDHGQGWYFGRPTTPDALRDDHPLPADEHLDDRVSAHR